MRTIAHRSLLIIAATLALCTPASAAEVARVDGAKLDVDESAHTGFCVDLTVSGTEGSGGSSTCGQAPWRARRSMVVALVREDSVLVGGAVPAAIARGEGELADGRRVGFDTVPGPGYHGRYAGKLRFFLAELPRTDAEDEQYGGVAAVRFFDAGGALEGISGLDYLGRRVGPSKLLLRERARGASTTVYGTVRRRLASTPLALDRFEEQPCLEVHTDRGSSGGSSRECRPPVRSAQGVGVSPDPGCRPLRTVITGFVGDDVSAIRLRLGSGRVLEVRSRTFRGARYVAARIPRGEAVRSVSAVGSPARYDLGEPPSGLPCLASSGSFTTFGFGGFTPSAPLPPGSGEQVGAEAGGHRLLVRDGDAERLCAAVDELDSDQTDCELPGIVAEDGFVLAGDGVVSAVLPAEVARVRLPDGRAVPVGEGAYTGRYRGAVRFLLAEADLGAGATVRALDAAGQSIATLPVYRPGPDQPVGQVARLAAGRGWRLGAARFAGYPQPCLVLDMRGETRGCSLVAARSNAAAAAVACTPRVAVLYGTLARRKRSVQVELRDGRTLRPRIVRLPRRLGGTRAFVLALPRRAQVRALRIGRSRATFPLLPAARQCGYQTYAPYLSAY